MVVPFSPGWEAVLSHTQDITCIFNINVKQILPHKILITDHKDTICVVGQYITFSKKNLILFLVIFEDDKSDNFPR